MMGMCPSASSTGVYSFDVYNEQAVISLGVYYLESGMQVSFLRFIYYAMVISMLYINILKCLPMMLNFFFF